MELDLEPRVKPLAYKVKATSRESTSQKAVNLLESDLKTHWSTGTNTKEWILLELDEPCLISHLRIYNKSVLEWEIAVGLRYKPETFVKVRPRCEAPRRDMVYPMNYTPCRYVRISCLRGNPIAIFFIQLIGISVVGLEPEFQPVVNYLLPEIISHKQDTYDIYHQMLQDVTRRLVIFLPQLETDLINFSESAEFNMKFLAMLAGPFYPILHILKERETESVSLHPSDSDMLRNKQTSNLTISSNFQAQPRRSRSPSALIEPASCTIAFRLDIVFALLRKAYKDSNLGTVCRAASRALHKLMEPNSFSEDLKLDSDLAVVPDNDDGGAKSNSLSNLDLTDYSSLYGDEFKILDDSQDTSYVNILDATSVEEAVLHVLYACVSQPHLCCKLADNNSDFLPVLPLIQAFLPALRPTVGSYSDQVDDNFSQWTSPFVQRALSQIITCSSSPVFHSLLCASVGYLSSYSPAHVKAACMLIDLCSGPLSSWIPTIIAKIDLAIDLLEDLLGTIQSASQHVARACAALKYIILALSGHMDDILPKYKELKHKLLFLVEMLDPLLDPAITATKNTISFGDVSTVFLEKQEQTCAIALNIIRSAVRRPAVLSSLEFEWRQGSVAPSILLSILDPHLPLPSNIDLCKCFLRRCNNESDEKCDSTEAVANIGRYEDASALFAPPELKNMLLVTANVERTSSENGSVGSEKLHSDKFPIGQIQNCLNLNSSVFSVDCINLQADYFQLVNLEDCESRASEFQRLSLDLHSRNEITYECHEAAIDSLLLAAECYINPFFLISFRSSPMIGVEGKTRGSVTKTCQKNDIISMAKDFKRNKKDIRLISHLERKRDKIVLEILLEAAELDRKYENQRNSSEESTDEVEDTGVTKTSKIDMQAADAVTLVRQNQSCLCYFLTQRLQREQQTLHEVLLQALLFYLHSATELHCTPETIIDILIKSAENLNAILTSFYFQLKESDGKLDFEKLHEIQRHWKLLQRLIIACSGSDSESEARDVTSGFHYESLVPLSSWMHRISVFSVSAFPLARFLGWMALYHYAKQYLKGRLFLAFELCQLTSLLSIFSDDLAVVDNITNQKVGASGPNICIANQCKVGSGHQNLQNLKDSFRFEHPDLQNFFPDMKLQFQTFGEIILEAVARQLKSMSAFDVSDSLCWLSDFCLSPSAIRKMERVSVSDSSIFSRGCFGKNAKAIILYLLEAIISEHMEAMIPEMPRIAQLLVSLCKASYCDVAFLDSILRVLMPLISYALTTVTTGENIVSDSSHDYEALCFGELFDSIKCKKVSDDISVEKMCYGPLMIFTLGTLLPYLSLPGKQEILQSLILWADFTSEPSSLCFDYLSAFQRVIESSVQVIVHTLEAFEIKVTEPKTKLDLRSTFVLEENLKHPSSNLENVQSSSPLSVVAGLLEGNCGGANLSSKGVLHLSPADVDDITKSLDVFFPKLYLAVEFCWELHFQLAQKLTVASSKCCLFLRCLASVSHLVSDIREEDTSDTVLSGSEYWKISLEGLTVDICSLQKNHCWNVASAMIDYLLDLPETFPLDCVLANICIALKNFCCYAPKISWRLQTDKWLSSLCTRDFTNVTDQIASLGDLFCTMLGHSEPEQRCIALQQLGRVVGMNINDEVTKKSYMVYQELSFHQTLSAPESVVSSLVSSTWNNVASIASCDPLLSLRASAVVLLSGYIPFASRTQVQSFLVSADMIFQGTGACTYPVQVPALSLSLVLLTCACLYSPSEDILLIPENVWSNLDNLRTSKSVVGVFEKKLCHALSELRAEPGAGKEKELRDAILSGCAAKQEEQEFRSMRESILEVVSSLTSVSSYFDLFSRQVDQEALELEEAEIELEFLQREKALLESSERSHEVAPPVSNFPCKINDHSKDDDRLSKLKIEIRNLERSQVKEEISARRQKKLLQRRMRQKYLEEASLREMELLQEVDRERTIEVQREIERQKLLELERAKTKELRYNLDLEREKQMQKELQRELEQAESGVQTSKQEFSSNPNGRTRERYRGRESGRSVHEGNARASSRVDVSSTPATSNVSTLAPGVLLASSRSFSNQTPTILQSRDGSVERVPGFEDSFDGSRDSGDAGSVGEADTGLAFEGGFGSTTRQGTRGSRSRQQIVDRREREGRREGKWERKHS